MPGAGPGYKDMLRKDSHRPFSDSTVGKDIREILNDSDTNPRKYPVALICTAAPMSRMNPIINTCYARAMDVLRVKAVKFFLIDSHGRAKIEELSARITMFAASVKPVGKAVFGMCGLN